MLSCLLLNAIVLLQIVARLFGFLKRAVNKVPFVRNERHASAVPSPSVVRPLGARVQESDRAVIMKKKTIRSDESCATVKKKATKRSDLNGPTDHADTTMKAAVGPDKSNVSARASTTSKKKPKATFGGMRAGFLSTPGPKKPQTKRETSAKAAAGTTEAVRASYEQKPKAGQLKVNTSQGQKKDAPRSTSEKKDAPRSTTEKKDAPHSTSEKKDAPRSTSEKKDAPRSTSEKKDAPRSTSEKKDPPRSTSEKKDPPHSTSEKKDAPRTTTEARPTNQDPPRARPTTEARPTHQDPPRPTTEARPTNQDPPAMPTIPIYPVFAQVRPVLLPVPGTNQATLIWDGSQRAQIFLQMIVAARRATGL